MHKIRLSLSKLLLPLVALALVAPVAPAVDAQTGAAPIDVAYTVAMPKPSTHLFEVTMSVGGLPANREYVDLIMPVWTPGSYLVREFARNVQDFRVAPASDANQELRWEKVNKFTWRVWPGGATGITATYRIYANEMSVRTSHLDDSHGYLNGANVFMYVDGWKDNPVRLTLEPKQGWKVATGLERVSSDRFVYTAPDYDRLADSPIEMSDFRLITFEALGKPHEIAIWGRGNYEAERLKTDFKKIVEAAGAIFGNTLPYDRYVFILQLYPGGGGLEHLNSTTMVFPPFAFQKKESYRGLLGLTAHEYFHLWLVKRIHPVALGPFDYTAENYTKMLWLMEGTTSYYANVLLLRAGLMTEKEFYEALAKEVKSLQSIPGRRHMSLEEASFDAWIKYYRQNEHSLNDQVSYYLKGEVVSAMLDLEIRGRTKGEKSLDDVMRYLWENYGQKGVGVPEDAVQLAVEAVAGSSFEEFFDAYIRGTEEIDYNRHLAHIGYKLTTEVSKDKTAVDETRMGAWLGANVSERNGRLVVTGVIEDSPAWAAGINADDELVAVDGIRATNASLDTRLDDASPGENVVVTLLRRNELRTVTARLGERPPDTYKIEKIEAEKKADAPDDKASGAKAPKKRS